ncbi:DUF134 domain-containing protein [bacterium]|nr:DUF134 domain-containing protein [bacterium]
MRPKKERWISCNASERCFRPKCKKVAELEGVILSLDEFEAMRLSYLEELKQEEVAKKMNIHRSTISRILASAHHKVADALVNLKAIKVEGGCCKVVNPRRKKK